MAVLSLELIIFLASIYISLQVKKRMHNLFFPPSGVTVFLTPEEEDLKAIREYKAASQKNLTKFKKNLLENKKTQMPVKILKATSKGFEQVKYMADLELVIMLTLALAFLLVVTEPIRFLKLIPYNFYSPNLSFYLLLSAIFLCLYNLWRMASAGGIEAYETKISILAALTITILLTIIFFLLSDYLFIDFDKIFQITEMQYKSITLEYFHGFSLFKKDYFFILMIFFTFFLVYCCVPIVIKFGNCYVDIMRDIYLQEQSIEHLRRRKEKGEVPEDKENDEALEADAATLKANKITLRWFNVSLTLQMIIIFLWIRPLLAPWTNISPHYQLVIDGMRFFFISANIMANLFTYKAEIAKYMSRAYDYISTLVQNPSPENLIHVQRKVRAYIQVMGLMSFQVVAKVLIPALLLLLLTQRKFAVLEQSAFNEHHMYERNDLSFFDWNCAAVFDPKDIVLQAEKCPLTQELEIVKVTPGLGWLSFGVEGLDTEFDAFVEAKEVIRKMNKYGLIHAEFFYMIFSLLLFIYYFSTYLLTIVYIFYRKQTEEAG